MGPSPSCLTPIFGSLCLRSRVRNFRLGACLCRKDAFLLCNAVMHVAVSLTDCGPLDVLRCYLQCRYALCSLANRKCESCGIFGTCFRTIVRSLCSLAKPARLVQDSNSLSTLEKLASRQCTCSCARHLTALSHDRSW